MVATPQILSELAPTAAELLERHLSTAKEWFPHEHVPWDRAADMGSTNRHEAVDQATASALFVNLLTEDNLPYYYETLDRIYDLAEPWTEWLRRWTAEEGRHSIVIRDYVTVSGLLDPYDLERGRMAQVQGAEVPRPHGGLRGFVYVALQELATRISHRNTGVRLRDVLADEAGYEVMQRVASDENRHYLFYRDVVTAALELEPSETVIAIEAEVRDFEMPGTGIADFDKHARAIAGAQIYDYTIHHDQILLPVVVRHWAIESLTGLTDEAEQARDRLLRRIALTRRAGERARARQAESSDRVPAAV